MGATTVYILAFGSGLLLHGYIMLLLALSYLLALTIYLAFFDCIQDTELIRIYHTT